MVPICIVSLDKVWVLLQFFLTVARITIAAAYSC